MIEALLAEPHDVGTCPVLQLLHVGEGSGPGIAWGGNQAG
jgi:hypothetical protein